MQLYAITLEELERAGYLFAKLNCFSEEDRKKEYAKKIEQLKSLPYQIEFVEFTDKERKDYNIDSRYNGICYFVILKDGKRVSDDMFYGSNWEKIITDLNKEDRYIQMSKAVVEKYTKEDRKKYKYLTGNKKYAHYTCIIDKETFKVVWIADSQFYNGYPKIYKNILAVDNKYYYMPTMEMVYEKKWSTSNSVITDSYIIVEVGLSEHKQAIMIDKVSGKLTEIN